MKITKNTKGFVKGLSINEYHGSRLHISSSILKLVLHDPSAAYDQIFKGIRKESKNQDAMNLGNYVHTLVLEPEIVEDEYALFTGVTRRGKEWDFFEMNNKDKIIISSSQNTVAQNLIKGLDQYEILHPTQGKLVGRQLFTKGDAEESCFFELDGILCKARFDYRLPNIVRDIKTCSGPANTKEEAKKIVNDWEYDLSAAFYLEALKQHDPSNKYTFEWVFMSKADNKTNVYVASEETLKRGLDKVMKAIYTIKDWKENGYTKPATKLEEI